VTPDSVAFSPDPLSVGMMSAPTIIEVQNPGTTTGPLQVAIQGGGPDADPGSFKLKQDSCSGSALDAGQTCSLAVTFQPQSGGTKTATLMLQGPANVSGYTFLFGQATTISVAPLSAQFGAIAVGSTSPPATFTVVAGPGATGVLQPLSVSDVTPGRFALTNDTCSGRTLAPGTRCTFDVTFSPPSTGAASASVFVESTDGSLLEVTVQGSGS
jgi:hypothetical protein